MAGDIKTLQLAEGTSVTPSTVTFAGLFEYTIQVSNPTNAATFNLTPSANIVYFGGTATSCTLAGIAAPTADSHYVSLHNQTNGPVTIGNESGSATAAADRILTGFGANISLPVNASIKLFYDQTSDRWRVISTYGGGIWLPTASGTPSLLDHYQETTLNTSWTFNNSGGTASATNVLARRVGKIVTITVPAVSDTPNASSTVFTSNTALDDEYRPATQVATMCRVQENGVNLATPGVLLIAASGFISIAKTAAVPTWANDPNSGLVNTATVSYAVS